MPSWVFLPLSGVFAATTPIRVKFAWRDFSRREMSCMFVAMAEGRGGSLARVKKVGQLTLRRPFALIPLEFSFVFFGCWNEFWDPSFFERRMLCPPISSPSTIGKRRRKNQSLS